jgi:hypothetical protein
MDVREAGKRGGRAKNAKLKGDRFPRTVWRSKAHHPTNDLIYEGYFILGINEEPGKQITYHSCGTCFWVARPPPNIGEHRKGFDARHATVALGGNRFCGNPWTCPALGWAHIRGRDRAHESTIVRETLILPQCDVAYGRRSNQNAGLTVCLAWPQTR